MSTSMQPNVVPELGRDFIKEKGVWHWTTNTNQQKHIAILDQCRIIFPLEFIVMGCQHPHATLKWVGGVATPPPLEITVSSTPTAFVPPVTGRCARTGGGGVTWHDPSCITLDSTDISSSLQLHKMVKAHSGDLTSVIVNDAYVFTAARSITIWSKDPLVRVSKIVGHTQKTYMLQMTDVGLWSAGDDSLRLWDLGTGEVMREIKDHAKGIRALYVTHQLLITGSSDKTVRTYW